MCIRDRGGGFFSAPVELNVVLVIHSLGAVEHDELLGGGLFSRGSGLRGRGFRRGGGGFRRGGRGGLGTAAGKQRQDQHRRE